MWLRFIHSLSGSQWMVLMSCSGLTDRRCHAGLGYSPATGQCTKSPLLSYHLCDKGSGTLGAWRGQKRTGLSWGVVLGAGEKRAVGSWQCWLWFEVAEMEMENCWNPLPKDSFLKLQSSSISSINFADFTLKNVSFRTSFRFTAKLGRKYKRFLTHLLLIFLFYTIFVHAKSLQLSTCDSVRPYGL